MAAYERGQYLEALKLWKLASQAGDAEASYRIGMLYAKRRGCCRSMPDTVVWYERAAKLGHVEAQFQLGLIFLYGARGAARSVSAGNMAPVVCRSARRQGIECSSPWCSRMGQAWRAGYRCRLSLDLGGG